MTEGEYIDLTDDEVHEEFDDTLYEGFSLALAAANTLVSAGALAEQVNKGKITMAEYEEQLGERCDPDAVDEFREWADQVAI
jgi:hypothetical protein